MILPQRTKIGYNTVKVGHRHEGVTKYAAYDLSYHSGQSCQSVPYVVNLFLESLRAGAMAG